MAVLGACVPFARGLSLTHIFYIRDLTMFFWPRHLWMHRSLLSGSWPLWDPYASAGQPVFPDALNQLFLLPVLILRLIPAVPGFNLIVAAPFPLAALGMWLFLRRYGSGASAALGAIVFAASGPVASTGNFPNLSWSVAWIPWIFWAVDRDHDSPSVAHFALVAVAIALQVLSGEPVTLVGTTALLVAYVVVCLDAPGGPRFVLKSMIRIGGAIVVGILLSTVQLVPMALAARVSPRGLMPTDNFWSVHPLWLVEAILPNVFGDSFLHYYNQVPWIAPLNSGRDPFFHVIYVGLVAALLGSVGMFVGAKRRRLFWLAVVCAATVLSLGHFTPVYPLLQRLVPPIRSFRFPAKFLVFASFGVAALAAQAMGVLDRADSVDGLSALSPKATRAMFGIAGIAGLALVALTALVVVAPVTGAGVFYRIGAAVGVADPVSGAAYLFDSLPPIAVRALMLLATSTLLVYLGSRAGREGGVARRLLFAVATVELLVATLGLNPVMPAARLGPPAWIAVLTADPDARFHFGGKWNGALNAQDIDLSGIEWKAPTEGTVEEGRSSMMANLAMAPAGWNARELLSYDLPLLWPVDNFRAGLDFDVADRSQRLRFLARGAVRYCLQSTPPFPGSRSIAPVGDRFGQMAVYDCVPDARRASVAARSVVVPDISRWIASLFEDPIAADSPVTLAAPPPGPAGTANTPGPPSARITTDHDTEVVIAAVAPAEGGFVVLRDSFADGWRAEVDGQPAPILRADALFRAVHIAPGPHTVRFSYWPTMFYLCLTVSLVTAVALAAVVMWSRMRRSLEPHAAPAYSAQINT